MLPKISPATRSDPEAAKIARTMEILQACGKGLVVAKIVYQKATEKWVVERLVEPYHLSYTSANLIVQCWQLNPELNTPCWRSFRVDRIVSAEPTTTTYKPRCAVILHTGEASQFRFGQDFSGTDQSEASPQQTYTEELRRRLQVENPSDEEIESLKKMTATLQIEQLRAIHGRLYAEELAEASADGIITQAELDRLTALRVWLTTLGWCP